VARLREVNEALVDAVTVDGAALDRDVSLLRGEPAYS